MTGLIDSPLGHWLSFEAIETGDGRLYSMTPGDAHVGNPLIKALHGGIVSTFLELAALHELKRALGSEANSSAININVDYLKSVKLSPLFAKARIAKVGRRLVFIDCAAWQDDENSPAAKAACSFAISK
ncbi:MAG TPA: PaaI family thioesterase [Parvularculaceae bacterium]|nr:PaaI family thioesterase [Amphiplicatus sp.]MCB2098431.1 PaaI family thioesterase [Parvularculaceae bacterium]MCB9954487.1 PaaI family thioesterase [Caulobacterales bacterium]HPE30933.1 PaaI family thioesterase [Parvularculaceae bacterium]HRX38285.1 PaaI family thioesterase [Parvularculaceae bacterium]